MALPLPAAREGRVVRARAQLAGGARTTVYVAAYASERTEIRVAVLRGPQRLEPWCAARGVREAIVGGFFVRPGGAPLGELRTRGVRRRHVPFAEPWDARRACVHVQGGEGRIAWRDELSAEPRGDLLQAGPLLVRAGAACFDRDEDAEGFSAASHQFDSDITDGRYPRAALGVARGRLLAVCCDGRADRDAGLSMGELAETMVALGARHALNLDGGGSTSLICGGRLRNHAREAHGVALAGGRAVSTALIFAPRR